MSPATPAGPPRPHLRQTDQSEEAKALFYPTAVHCCGLQPRTLGRKAPMLERTSQKAKTTQPKQWLWGRGREPRPDREAPSARIGCHWFCGGGYGRLSLAPEATLDWICAYHAFRVHPTAEVGSMVVYGIEEKWPARRIYIQAPFSRVTPGPFACPPLVRPFDSFVLPRRDPSPSTFLFQEPNCFPSHAFPP